MVVIVIAFELRHGAGEYFHARRNIGHRLYGSVQFSSGYDSIGIASIDPFFLPVHEVVVRHDLHTIIAHRYSTGPYYFNSWTVSERTRMTPREREREKKMFPGE